MTTEQKIIKNQVGLLPARGTKYCGRQEDHEYQLYLSLEAIDHSKTRARSPQSNGICERFHKTELNEFYGITFRKKIYNILNELQTSWVIGSSNIRKSALQNIDLPALRPGASATRHVVSFQVMLLNASFMLAKQRDCYALPSRL